VEDSATLSCQAVVPVSGTVCGCVPHIYTLEKILGCFNLILGQIWATLNDIFNPMFEFVHI